MITYRDIEKALLDAVDSMSINPTLPVAWPNVDFTKPDDKKYLEVIHFPNDPIEYSWQMLQSATYQGILQINVHGATNLGTLVMQSIIDQIFLYFIPDTVFVSGDTKVKVNGIPRQSSLIVEENYIPLRIPYKTLDY